MPLLIALTAGAFSSGCRSETPAFKSAFNPSLAIESQNLPVKAEVSIPRREMYRLRVGDILTITAPEIVVPHETLFRIQPDGTINVPSVGRFAAAGKTVQQLQKEIGEKDPRYRGGALYPCPCDLVCEISGEVNAPGAKVFNETITLSMAIKEAGGFTAFADTNLVKIVHRHGESETLKPSARPEQNIYSGDSIKIRGRGFLATWP